MSLTTMTPEWKGIADEIMIFVIRKRKERDIRIQTLFDNPTALYNWWVYERGYAIANVELALWCVGYMHNLLKMPLDKLIRAAEIDNLQY